MHDLGIVDLSIAPGPREKILLANRAVLGAIRSFLHGSVAEPHTLLGMSSEAFQFVLRMPANERVRIERVSFPIWQPCIEVAVDRSAQGGPLAIENVDTLLALAGDGDAISRREIGVANRAILEAILAFRGRHDPAATFILGMRRDRLDRLHKLQLSDLERVSRVTVPIWRARFDMAPGGDGKAIGETVLGRDHMIRTLMKELAPE